jgi:glucokinase
VYLCFDVGGTSVKAGIIDESGTIIIKRKIPTVTGDVQAMVSRLQEGSSTLCEEAQISKSAIKAVGVGIPGFVQEETGLITKAVNLGWENVPIADLLSVSLGHPVCVINDANAAALGEMWRGAGRGQKNLLCLTIGTGIGAGVIINERIHNGIHGLAGEIGHFRVRPEEGRLCNCGRIGCLETESSASAIAFYGEEAVKQGKAPLLAEALKRDGEVTSRSVAEAAAQGEEAALEIYNRSAYYLGFALSNVFSVLAPEKMIIGGGAAEAGSLLFTPLIESFNRFIFTDVKGEDIIVPALLGNDAGIVGLAYLAHTIA